jgi:site-specific DNA-methyltransferase (adenine-specific)
MKNLPAKSVDLFVCDLPYGCLGPLKKGGGIPRENTDGAFGGCNWDIPIDLGLFWEQIRRLRKNDHTPCIMFCNIRFGYELIKSNEKEFRYDLVWNKPNGVGFLSANKQPLRSHELIYVFAKKGAFYNRIDIEGDFLPYTKPIYDNEGGSVYNIKGKIEENVYDCADRKKPIERMNAREGTRCVKSVIEAPNGRRKGQHPTAKPVELYKWLIERYSNENDTVLDPTFGSGNSGLASTELKRLYIGIEKDETFFNKFATSINNESIAR